MHNLSELVDIGEIYSRDVIQDKLLLELFCEFYQVELLDILDNRDPQLKGLFTDCGGGIPVYVFTDDLGGYLAEGIMHCLGYNLEERKKKL